jgi:hypothetical protein
MRIFAMAGYAALMARALITPVCHFLVDESPQFFGHDVFAARVGALATNGPKFGVRLLLISQFPDIIFKSVAGADIAQTLNVIMVGKIQQQVIASLEHFLGYNTDLLKKCTDENFKPNETNLRSNWLLRTDQYYNFCGYYPSELQLALTANDLPESQARQRFLEYYKDDPIRGMLLFAPAYIQARKSNMPMDMLHPETAASRALQIVSA